MHRGWGGRGIQDWLVGGMESELGCSPGGVTRRLQQRRLQPRWGHKKAGPGEVARRLQPRWGHKKAAAKEAAAQVGSQEGWPR